MHTYMSQIVYFFHSYGRIQKSFCVFAWLHLMTWNKHSSPLKINFLVADDVTQCLHNKVMSSLQTAVIVWFQTSIYRRVLAPWQCDGECGLPSDHWSPWTLQKPDWEPGYQDIWWGPRDHRPGCDNHTNRRDTAHSQRCHGNFTSLLPSGGMHCSVWTQLNLQPTLLAYF